MFGVMKLLTFLVYLTIITAPSNGFCTLNITSIPVRSSFGITDPPQYFEFARYTPLEQLRPLINDPEHLLNLIYDPRGPGCVYLQIERHSGRSWITLMPTCLQQRFDSFVSLELKQIPTNLCRMHELCYECNSRTIEIAKNYRGFGREQLRMSFLYGHDLMLLEDLSSRVPEGSWMMMRKEKASFKSCQCERLNVFAAKFNIVNVRVRNGSKMERIPKKRNDIVLAWIVASIAVPILVVMLCLCLQLLF